MTARNSLEFPTARAAHKRRAVRRRAPGRPAYGATEGLRELYLQSALDVFIARGYAGASIEEIARAAKAGKLTFYRRFGTKAELFRLVSNYAIAKVRERLRTPVGAKGAPKRVLRDMIARLYVALTDPEYLALLRLVVAESERFPELSRALLSNDRFLLEPVLDYLTRAATDGRLTIADPYAGAMQLAALASGGSRFLLKKPRTGRRSREHWIAAVLQFVLNAWRPRRPRAARAVREKSVNVMNGARLHRRSR
jgi:AcrR family transcriptional regulator